MGRKLQSKQNSRNRNTKDSNKFLQQRRKELSILVDKLLKLTSTFQSTSTVTQTWEHHLQIEAIIKEIVDIESSTTIFEQNNRKLNLEKYENWLREHGAQFEGVKITEFEGYELGLQATKEFPEGSLILTVPYELMMTEINAKQSALGPLIASDPLLQNMSNVTLALFLLLEKSNPDSFWKPYIDALPDQYSTVLYYTSDELAELRPSPALEGALQLRRSVCRQYAYFRDRLPGLPALQPLADAFSFDAYRWAVSTVMTRQNGVQLAAAPAAPSAAFIPLWDMCNHEPGEVTTGYDARRRRGECYALRDFRAGDQIFIFYGARTNRDLFLHNGFVCPDNPHDALALALGVGAADEQRAARVRLLGAVGATGAALQLRRGERPVPPELLAFARVFCMGADELRRWAERDPAELLRVGAVGAALERRALAFLRTRCSLLRAAYRAHAPPRREHARLLKECELRMLDAAERHLGAALERLPAVADDARFAA